MAGAGYRDWVAGDVPTAVQFDTFLQEQTVMVFATAAARDTALSTAKSEGMVTYQLDTNTFTVYSGAAWSTIGPVHGGLASWTPTWTQSATISKTIQQATYSRVGRQITANFSMTATSAGTAANPILFGLPVAAASNVQAVGWAVVFDASVSTFFSGFAYMQGASAFGLLISSTNPTGVFNSLTIASGDLAYGTVTYEAAADG